jgi:addiction module HigA family antidote
LSSSSNRERLPEPLHPPDELSPVHPGEILLEEFLRPIGVSVYALAKRAGVPGTRIHEIVHERRAISADTAIRLGAVLGTTPEFWLGLQMSYDLKMTKVETANLQPIVA